MGRMKTLSGWWAVAIVLAIGFAHTAGAIYLDEDQNINLRSRIYSQASVRVQDSRTDTVPSTKAGQVVQHRNFFNPELEAKFTSYTTWMKTSFLSFMAPDDLSMRLAAWGFYDGIYDYGAGQFNTSQKQINATYPDLNPRVGAFYLEGEHVNTSQRGGTLATIFPGAEVQNPRDIYTTQRRINELYVNYSKGPVFVRIGKQAISWGESDTIALLDQNNPFDITQAAPGLFEDLDESRIPLWTVRTSLTLFDTLGPLSSGFVEAYWVPGEIDNNTGTLPLLTASPYSPRGQDPQSLVRQVAGPFLRAQFVLIDHIPRKSFTSSRYGFRVQTVVNRFFTVSGWFYTAFPSQPPPLSHGLTRVAGSDTQLFTTETVHDLITPVFGLANTFFLEPLDSIVRMEAEYFNREPSFIPQINLGVNAASAQNPLLVLQNCTGETCRVARASYLRWELGLDRFFFLRALNPTNSFTWVTALVGSWNMDENSIKDYRFAGQRKPGATGNSPDDFVQQKKVEAFVQTHLQTDYVHGRLSPGITLIGYARGTYAVNPTIQYRWTDWLLFNLNFIYIGGEYQSLGFFRDRGQISARMTYQLN
jgi:hypothetical protein